MEMELLKSLPRRWRAHRQSNGRMCAERNTEHFFLHTYTHARHGPLSSHQLDRTVRAMVEVHVWPSAHSAALSHRLHAAE